MKYFHLILLRFTSRKWRYVFTTLSVIAAFFLFGILSASRDAFEGGVRQDGEDRMLVVNKASPLFSLPLRHFQVIRETEGVDAVTHQSWVGGYIEDRRNTVGAFAVEPASYLELRPELQVWDHAREQWLNDRTGALVGADLAARHGWKIGDRIALQSYLWSRTDMGNTWDVRVSGLYEREDDDRPVMSIFIHYDYLDAGRRTGRGRIGGYIVRVEDPERAEEIAAKVDATFANSPAETKTANQKVFAQALSAQFADIGTIANAISGAAFFTMLLVIGSSIGQSVRERTREFAIMRSLGFSGSTIAPLIFGESVLVTAFGGFVGLALAHHMASLSNATLAEYLPSFGLGVERIALGALWAVAFGVIAALLPAMRAVRIRFCDALRSA